jgi:PPM family protein phosphatase
MNANLRIEYGGHSDVGLVRKENQDTFGVYPEGETAPGEEGVRLFVVADGMGGHKGGGDASRIAVGIICDSFSNSSRETIPDLLRTAFQRANEAIYKESLHMFPPGIMGSTCTALAIAAGNAFIGHVGDSRAYRVSGSTIEQLTEDHSVVGEMQRRGLLSRDAALIHPDRSQITRALGVKPEVKVDVIEGIPLEGSETFLLCTDYIPTVVSEEELRDTVLSRSAQDACRAIVELAVSRGGEDNVTAQVVHIQQATTQPVGGRGLLRRG